MGTRPRKRLFVKGELSTKPVDTGADSQMIKKITNKGSDDVTGYFCRLATEAHLTWVEAIRSGMVSEGG